MTPKPIPEGPYNSAQANAFISHEMPARHEAEYVYDYGSYLIDSVNFDEPDGEELKRNINNAINFLIASATMYQKLQETEVVNAINLELATIDETIADRLFKKAMPVTETSIPTTLFYLKLADNYLSDAKKMRKKLNVPTPISLHMSRLIIYIFLEKIVDVENAEKYRYFIQDYIKAYDLQNVSEKFSLEAHQKPILEFYEALIADYGLPSKKRKRAAPDDTENAVTQNNARPSPARHGFLAGPLPNTLSSNNDELFYAAIEEFLQTAGNLLDIDLASKIILEVAEIYKDDVYLQKSLNNTSKAGRLFFQSLYEASMALFNPVATEKLAQHRDDNPKLTTYNVYRVSEEHRKTHESMHRYINTEIQKAAEERMNKGGIPGYLRYFFDNHKEEIEEFFPADANRVLRDLLYELGMKFANRTITLPRKLDRNEIAYIFINKAAMLQHPDAKIWAEMHEQQVAKESSMPRPTKRSR